MDGDLSCLGAENKAFHAQNVSDVPFLKALIVGLFPHIIPLHIDLNLPGMVHNVGKGGLAHDPTAHHSAGNVHGLLLPVGKLSLHLLRIGIHRIGGKLKGVLAGLHQCAQLVSADLQQFRKLLLLACRCQHLILCHFC